MKMLIELNGTAAQNEAILSLARFRRIPLRELPLNGEVNPEHPVTKAAHENWHKICALIMAKLNLKHLSIPLEFLMKWADNPKPSNIVLRDTGISLELTLADEEETKRIVKEYGL